MSEDFADLVDALCNTAGYTSERAASTISVYTYEKAIDLYNKNENIINNCCELMNNQFEIDFVFELQNILHCDYNIASRIKEYCNYLI